LKNVTIVLDEKVADWARIEAAKRRTSVSRLLGEMLAERMREEDSYAKAMNEFLAGKPEKLRKSDKENLPSRSEIYRDERRLRG